MYSILWVCLMVDRVAIESMLRVYGPPATEIFNLHNRPNPRRNDISFLPYLTAVSTSFIGETEDEESIDEESEDKGSGSESIGSEDTRSEASGSEEIDDEVQEAPMIDDRENK